MIGEPLRKSLAHEASQNARPAAGWTFGHEDVGFRSPGRVARGHDAARIHLLEQEARRQGLVIDMAAISRICVAEDLHQRPQGKETVARGVEHEFRVVGLP
jgi:hypothetical protein